MVKVGAGKGRWWLTKFPMILAGLALATYTSQKLRKRDEKALVNRIASHLKK